MQLVRNSMLVEEKLNPNNDKEPAKVHKRRRGWADLTGAAPLHTIMFYQHLFIFLSSSTEYFRTRVC